MANNPYKNKIIYDGTTLLDLTSDTIAANVVVSGYTGHSASGAPFTGSLVVQTYYTGTTDPPANLGNNGDIYLKVVS